MLRIRVAENRVPASGRPGAPPQRDPAADRRSRRRDGRPVPGRGPMRPAIRPVAGAIVLIPGGTPAAGTSTLNYVPDKTRANNAIIGVDALGRISAVAEQA